jgi:hypothetical protein
VRSSWLALAMKSARVRSARRGVGLLVDHQQACAPARPPRGVLSARQRRSCAAPLSQAAERVRPP